jgi:hypothetical protein
MPSVSRGFHRLLEDEHHRLEAALSALELALCDGDTVTAGSQLAAFEVGLTRCVRVEETLLVRCSSGHHDEFAPTAKMRREHIDLWKLATGIWDAIARADLPRALEMMGRLRSVFLLHLTKEKWSIYPLLASTVPATTEDVFLRSLTTSRLGSAYLIARSPSRRGRRPCQSQVCRCFAQASLVGWQLGHRSIRRGGLEANGVSSLGAWSCIAAAATRSA